MHTGQKANLFALKHL
uniref:Uncharacterized protein n=1 Tax=Anguilla anguilla TaxID=7936 RepID=A0A0E9W0R5_ANGAN